MPNAITTHAQQFPGLGTTVEGGIRTTDILADQAWGIIRRQVDQFAVRFSRFNPETELSRLNARSGGTIKVSTDMMKMFLAAKKMWSLSEGTVDPTIGRALVQAGYDATFAKLTDTPADGHKHQPVVPVSLADVEVNAEDHTITVPAGIQIDFGGVGKGYLLDQLAEYIENITKHYWISLGGDVLISGRDEGDRPWSIGIQNPERHDQDIGSLTVPLGRWSVATSGTTKRRGVHHGRAWHHLIDPATGRPAETDVLAAAVMTPSGLESDALAKTVLIRGSIDGLAWAEKKHRAALVVTAELRVLSTSAMKPLIHLYA